MEFLTHPLQRERERERERMGSSKEFGFFSSPEAAAAAIFCLALAYGFAMNAGQVHGQSTESLGFVSIDCGLSNKSMTYTDSGTSNITYVSDHGFIDADAGINANISGAYVSPTSMPRRYLNVRSFPNGSRNCYTISDIIPNSKYLVRGTFMYGNYDGLNSAQIMFDLYLGVNLWKTMNITDPAAGYRTEVITVTVAEFVEVCLVNTGQGTPFISGLDLRPIKDTLYPQVNRTRSLVLKYRFNAGPSDIYVRYPDDRHDRIWDPFFNSGFWQEITTNSTVQNLDTDYFEAPTKVMQTAVVPVNSDKLLFYWDPEPGDINEYYAIVYFSELFQLSGNMTRQFYIKLNGNLWYSKAFTPDFLYSDYIYGYNPLISLPRYNVSLEATSNSTLPPLLNAIEIYTTMRNNTVPSDLGDVHAMMEIKADYQIKKNWMGDPCSPKVFTWDGLTCTYSLNGSPRITALNLSSSNLSGGITTSFGNLDMIQSLDLSYNNLTGTIPDDLGRLSSLNLLDLTGNQLNGLIPSALLAKSQDGSLTIRTGGNKLLCKTGSSCAATGTPSSSKKKIATSVIIIICVLAVLALLVAGFLIFKLRRKDSGRATSIKPQNDVFHVQTRENQNNPLQLENRQFTYLELKKITNNFEIELGKGGFGTVYYGSLEDGTQIAIKMLSESSSQGTREFLAEAQHLTKVHHRNLVSLVGYCNDPEHLALAYEFMSQGSIQQHLRGRARSARPLSWRQRLQIAVEAAQGLDYLHKGCRPPLIHRDIKTANILLSERLEAKIADFGLTKAFLNNNSHISTAVVGTPGYLDPEYYMTYQISEKSDVYSFGVVLLELITGKPPLLQDNSPVVQWVRQSLARGNIEDIVDSSMLGNYDLNSVWKCADIALKCTSHSSHQRPIMAEVVVQLKESLELETAIDTTDHLMTTSENMYSETTDVSQNSAIEIENIARMSAVGGPSAR